MGKDVHEDTSKTEEEAPEADGDARVKELEESLSKLADSFARLQANYENYIKRAEKQKEGVLMDAKHRVIGRILPAIDSLELAVKDLREKGNLSTAQTEGLTLVLKQFHQTLEQEGVARINAVGEKFDPEIHEAINTSIQNDTPEGMVVEEAQPGYTLGGRPIRCSKVTVSIHHHQQQQEETTKKEE